MDYGEKQLWNLESKFKAMDSRLLAIENGKSEEVVERPEEAVMKGEVAVKGSEVGKSPVVDALGALTGLVVLEKKKKKKNKGGSGKDGGGGR
jgi:hypothetical protein